MSLHVYVEDKGKKLRVTVSYYDEEGQEHTDWDEIPLDEIFQARRIDALEARIEQLEADQ